MHLNNYYLTMKKIFCYIPLVIMCLQINLFNVGFAQQYEIDKFSQLNQELPAPNVYRTASGAPGEAYWQQRADYEINITLNHESQTITGDEIITYYNNSPDVLTYIWLQLDQNVRAKDSDSHKIKTSTPVGSMSLSELHDLHHDFDGGFKLKYVKNQFDKDVHYVVNKTMMRIDLEKPLQTNDSVVVKIGWSYLLNNRLEIGGRSGYEFFEKDSNYLYTIAQFYPRMCVYSDYQGWQNKQFLKRGEFTLPFGKFSVAITAPANFVVAATGRLMNANEILSEKQQKRLLKAKDAKTPVFIVTENEAKSNEKQPTALQNKTWYFYADSVRDFAFAASKKFIWDALGVPFGKRTVMAMSFYPKEGNPIWSDYSTRVVAHTIKTYSKYTFDYPYPVAQSVHSKEIGMEYPMISFNGGRPYSNGMFLEFTKNHAIRIITHEVGHNYFPMIVNSDERQWTWMDEGLNTFLQYLTEKAWDKDFESWAGEPSKIARYMRGNKEYMVPIMTNSESLHQFSNNAYFKPATALNILRETVMGPELFDYAFKEYANRWKFKHPTPADFFRTMEDASGVDLDWFWRGWFFTTDHVDIAIREAKIYHIGDVPEKKEKDKQSPYAITILDRKSFDENYAHEFANRTDFNIENYYYIKIRFDNIGGLVMPIILKFEYADGSHEIRRIPAEIWLKNRKSVVKTFVTDKNITNIILDPDNETADTNTDNNYWPNESFSRDGLNNK